ncbi:alpha/beta fold hydrolase [Aquabacterium sp.]|uniref:alpha/beta fold hydrolase n=1 Tax=Aquabacterium sp. TaxID=1872578 RepID=UPI003D6D8F69
MSALSRHNVRQAGQGQPLLFAHGYGCDQSVWRFMAPAFETTHRVVLMDLAGCGTAAPDAYDQERHATLHGHAQDIISVCESAQLEGTVLVAHSVSTMSAVLAARTRPDLFSALVMLAPSPSYLNHEGYQGGFERQDIDDLLHILEANHFKWARMMAPVVMGSENNPALSEELATHFCRMEASVAKHFAQVTFLSDHREDLDGLSIPTLVMQCTRDTLAPASVGQYLQSRWPQVQLAKLEATGHCPHMSAPQEATEVLRAFLEAQAHELVESTA